MRSFLIVALCLAALAATVQGDLVCGLRYCQQHPCTGTPVPVSSCKVGTEFRAKHSGRCACCPACVTLLDSGAHCKTYSAELGETPLSICRAPLQCIGSTCQTKPKKH